MPDFNAKMHQNRFRLGLRPRPHWGSLQRSPDPLAGFKGPTSKGRGEEGRGGEGGEGTGEEGRGGEGRGARPMCHLVLTNLATGLHTAMSHGSVGDNKTHATSGNTE